MTTPKSKISKEKRAEIEAKHRAIGMAIGLSTDRTDVPAMQATWNALYRRAERTPPELTWVVPGPLAAHVAMRLLACDDPKETADNTSYFSTKIVDPALFTSEFFEGLWGSLVTSLGAARVDEYRDELAWLAKAVRRAGTSIPISLRAAGLTYEHTCFWGAHEVYWTQWTRAEMELGEREHTPEQIERIEEYEGTVKNGGWAWTFEKACVVMEKPEIQMTEPTPGFLGILRYHNAAGPAVKFRDGYQMFRWHGIGVTEQTIMAPETLTAAIVNAEPNAEVRRVMLERMGMERYVKESSAEVLDRSDFGTLYRIPKPETDDAEGTEDFVAVEVTNSTPEPGTGIHTKLVLVNPETGQWEKAIFDTGKPPVRRNYLVPVPPTMRRAREAVAWTFGLDEQDYVPDVQT